MESRILKAMESIGKPAETWVIADFIKRYNDTPTVLRKLKKLEKQGSVSRHDSSRRNGIVWVLK